MRRGFRQVDVFTDQAYLGNPVAVVLDAEGLSTEEMQTIARWTNLSETTFVQPATQVGADYRVRIFTPVAELPFAGHPTLGTCHAWLESNGEPRDEGRRVVQECGVGLVEIRCSAGNLAFAAPDLIRGEDVDASDLDDVTGQLGIRRDQVVDAQWADNGPGWVAVLLADAEAVLAVDPGALTRDIGVVGFHPAGSAELYEVRAFFPVNGRAVEDPVTGSLNASLAQWLIRTGRATPPYVAAQGTALGRTGRVHIELDVEGQVWVGGGTITCVDGTVDL